jgi:hypothetical protein
MVLCKCGCGQECKNLYVHGHNARNKKLSLEEINRIKKLYKENCLNKGESICLCGCGNYCMRKYVKGHNKGNLGKKATYNKILNLHLSHVGQKVKHSIATKNKISIKLLGHPGAIQSEGYKRKMREFVLNRLKNKIMLKPYVSVGGKEKQILDEIEQKNNIKIDRNFSCIGYKPDGYCYETNTIYEVDEKYHFDVYGNLKEKDLIRQKRLEDYLKCKFIRIKDC